MKKSIIIVCLFLLSNCFKNNNIKRHKQFVVRVDKVDIDSKNSNNLGYFLINNSIERLDELKENNKQFNVNNIVGELVSNYNAIPILDYPIRFWKQSCEENKLVKPQNIAKMSYQDSIALSKIDYEMKNISNYSVSELATPNYIKYKLLIGFAEIKNSEYCIIKWTHKISDSTVVLGKNFKLDNN